MYMADHIDQGSLFYTFRGNESSMRAVPKPAQTTLNECIWRDLAHAMATELLSHWSTGPGMRQEIQAIAKWLIVRQTACLLRGALDGTLSS